LSTEKPAHCRPAKRKGDTREFVRLKKAKLSFTQQNDPPFSAILLRFAPITLPIFAPLKKAQNI